MKQWCALYVFLYTSDANREIYIFCFVLDGPKQSAENEVSSDEGNSAGTLNRGPLPDPPNGVAGSLNDGSTSRSTDISKYMQGSANDSGQMRVGRDGTCMGSANERRRYIVTSSLIGRAHTPNVPWWVYNISHDFVLITWCV